MSKWLEIRNDYVDEDKNVVCIDAWKTLNGSEEGKVIAEVNLDTKSVVYLDENAKTDSYAQEVIKETIAEIENKLNKKYIEILSVEECSDKDYGESIVQYRVGDEFISFSFCDVDVTEDDFNLDEIKEEVLKNLDKEQKQPLWSELSDNYLNAVLRNPFDMCFIEYDDPTWTEKMADELWEEVCKLASSDTVVCGVDDCLVTVYAGAIGDINWKGHPEYGVPCLENVIALEKVKSLDKRMEEAKAGLLSGEKKQVIEIERD